MATAHPAADQRSGLPEQEPPLLPGHSRARAWQSKQTRRRILCQIARFARTASVASGDCASTFPPLSATPAFLPRRSALARGCTARIRASRKTLQKKSRVRREKVPSTLRHSSPISSDRRVDHALQGRIVVGLEARIVVPEVTALRSSDLPVTGSQLALFPSRRPFSIEHRRARRSKFVKPFKADPPVKPSREDEATVGPHGSRRRAKARLLTMRVS